MKSDRCPLCGQPAAPEFKPFCSRGCQDRDLLKWLGDGYRIPGPAVDPDASVDGMEAGVDKDDDPD